MCYYTNFALFYSEFEGNFQVQVPGGLSSKGRFKGADLEGAYFRTFTVSQPGLDIPLYPELAQSRQIKTGPNIDRRKPVLACFFF